MYGFVESYSRLCFHVISSSFVHYLPVNNNKLLVYLSFVLHDGELWGFVGQLLEWIQCSES